MNKSEEVGLLATALSLAQGEIENAAKKSENPHFRSKYADLAEILNTVRPVFSKNGLSVTQFPSYNDGIVSVETILLHKSGQWLSGTISAPVSKQDAQGVGSATTYCRRYSLAAVAGLAQEDDDANAAVGHKPVQKAKFDENQIEQRFSECQDMVSLAKLWSEIPRTEQPKFLAMKEKRKAEIGGVK